MLKREVICAFYNPEIKNHNQYHSFMKVVVENKKKIRPIYFEDDEGKILLVFYKHRLKKLSKLFPIGARNFYENIMNGKCRRCSKCGCEYLSYIQYIYRNNSGCVSKSCECEVCSGYSDQAVREIRDYARKRGTKKTLLKVLNDRFFKDEVPQNTKSCSDEDLPF